VLTNQLTLVTSDSSRGYSAVDVWTLSAAMTSQPSAVLSREIISRFGKFYAMLLMLLRVIVADSVRILPAVFDVQLGPAARYVVKMCTSSENLLLFC